MKNKIIKFLKNSDKFLAIILVLQVANIIVNTTYMTRADLFYISPLTSLFLATTNLIVLGLFLYFFVKISLSSYDA